ncbi:MAG: Gfo/Idh/MocA family oxidoreductase [Bacteroidota bacterium]
MMQRRQFLRHAAGGTAALWTAPWSLGATGVAPSDQVQLAVIGVGSRGRWMMEQALQVPGVRLRALCEVYEPHTAQAHETLAGLEVPVYTDYRALLDQESELDAVLIATPLGVHAGPMIAAAERGLHIYGEKALAFTQDECDAVVRAVQQHGVHFQIGHQYRHAPRVKRAVERILAGEIGRVTHIYAYWHRNNNWRRPVPDPAHELHVNWRLYDTWSRGLLAELGSHQVDFANWIFGETPTAVLGSGGIDTYHDGRQTYDNVQALFTYPSGGSFFFSSILNNHKMGYQIHVMGTEGTAELRFEDAWFYYEPWRPNSAVPKREEGASWAQSTPSLSVEGDRPYDGPGAYVELPEDDPGGSADYRALRAFFEDLRADTRPWADEVVGWNATAPILAGQRAVRTGEPQIIPTWNGG